MCPSFISLFCEVVVVFQVKLVEVERVEWINKKSYSTVGLTLQARESRVLLRAAVGLEDWFELLEVQYSHCSTPLRHRWQNTFTEKKVKVSTLLLLFYF